MSHGRNLEGNEFHRRGPDVSLFQGKDEVERSIALKQQQQWYDDDDDVGDNNNNNDHGDNTYKRVAEFCGLM